MIQDTGVSEMGWTVGYEAGEALKSIRGESAWDQFEPQKLPSPYPLLEIAVSLPLKANCIH
jgi:hypothetical protein